VKQGEIIRLAWGVFVRTDDYESGMGELPGPLEVARVKALAFCRNIFTLGEDIETALNIIQDTDDSPVPKYTEQAEKVAAMYRKNAERLIKRAEDIRFDRYLDSENRRLKKKVRPTKVDFGTLIMSSQFEDINLDDSSTLVDRTDPKVNSEGQPAADFSDDLARGAEESANCPLAEEMSELGTVSFATDGHSTSFFYGKIRVVLKCISARKRFLADSPCSLFIRILWVLGRDWLKHHCAWDLIRDLRTQRLVRQMMRKYIDVMPTWMSQGLFVDLRPGFVLD
jgi:hypothetical protein